MQSKRTWRLVSRQYSSSLTVVGLLAVGVAYTTAFLKMYSRWWFEDDPSLFAYAGAIGNPIAIFVDPNVLRHFTTGKALVPMQILSYWIDVHLAGYSPQFAYAHQVCSFLLTLLLLYLVLLRFLQGHRLVAFFVSMCWALLPATAVVLQFLSARHYLEGLLFSTLAIYILERGVTGASELSWNAQVAALLSAIAALLCKEIYVAVLPAVLMFYSWRYRDRRLGLATIATVCAYIAYRFWMVGPAFDYNMALLSPRQYLAFLSKLPYTFSANYGGYFVCGIVALLAFQLLRTRRKSNATTLLYFAALFVLSLAAVVPVSRPLYGTIRFPGTWYRIVFIPHTLAIVCCGYLAVRCTSPLVRTVTGIVLLAILIPGVRKTDRVWAEMTASAEREGKFYLKNPDKVLLSDQEAWWFIPGIDLMYKVKKPHYVLIKDVQSGQVQAPKPVWRFEAGVFAPDYWPLRHALAQ